MHTTELKMRENLLSEEEVTRDFLESLQNDKETKLTVPAAMRKSV